MGKMERFRRCSRRTLLPIFLAVDIFVGADVPEKFKEEKFLAGLGRLLSPGISFFNVVVYDEKVRTGYTSLLEKMNSLIGKTEFCRAFFTGPRTGYLFATKDLARIAQNGFRHWLISVELRDFKLTDRNFALGGSIRHKAVDTKTAAHTTLLRRRANSHCRSGLSAEVVVARELGASVPPSCDPELV
jgi:hypothetical protein